MKKVLILILPILLLFMLPGIVFPQSALSDLENAAGRSISSVNVPMPSAPSAVSSGSSVAKTVMSTSSTSVSNIVAGAVMQSLLNSLFNPTPQKSQAQIEAEKAEQERQAAEAEAERQAEIARQQAIHDKLINSSKTLDGSGSLDFKTLDGDMEKMKSDASKPFDQNSNGANTVSLSNGTNFFGVPMSEPDAQTLLDTEASPIYSDVKTSVDETDKYIDDEKHVVKIIGGKTNEAKGEPIVQKIDCKAVSEKLARYEKDMIRFNGWNHETLNDLNEWEKKNDDAFWNAVNDGASAAFGPFVDYLKETRSSASMIKKVLESNEQKYIADKVFTPAQIAQYKNILDQRIATCNISDIAKESMKPWDYVNLTRNLMQGTTEKLAKSDGDCMQIVNVLKKDGYLSDVPWVDAGQFLAGELINKFMHDPSIVLKPNSVLKHSFKVPYVTVSQLVVDETYNATDWLTSYKNTCTLREADGKASEAMKKIRGDMDEMRIQLQGCPLGN